MAGSGSYTTLDDGAEPGEKAQHVDGIIAQPKTPAATPDSTGTAAMPAQTSPFVRRQIWACLNCKTKRQWGTLRFSQAQKAAAETGEVIVHEPILWCAGCKDNRPHVWSHDEGGML